MKSTNRGSHAQDNLKIMIVSTPKTGNTWIKHLLLNVYELPMVEVGTAFDAAELDALGPRWITQQHYAPQADLLDWARYNDLVFVTMVRHPCDVLVSLFHFVSNFADQPEVIADSNPAKIMLHDEGTIGEYTASYVMNTFFELLDISVDWMCSTESKLVYYEDLRRYPLVTLQELTDSICEVSLDRIQYAIESCNINTMRKQWGEKSKFFRSGNVGDWQEELTQRIIRIFRHTDPYPFQFAALGYGLDPDDPSTALPRKPRPSSNPFRYITHFDNGVPVPSVVARLYLSLDSNLRKRWSNLEQTRAETFYSWLNAPAEEDPRQPSSRPLVTNLAYYINRTDRTARSLFPDCLGDDRVAYVAFLIDSLADKYELDQAFVRPMQDSLAAWGNGPALPLALEGAVGTKAVAAWEAIVGRLRRILGPSRRRYVMSWLEDRPRKSSNGGRSR